jgi:uncharacterized protein (DUF1499 family)
MRNTLGVIGIVAFVLGPLLAYVRVVPGIVGFVLFGLGGVLTLGVGVASIIQAVRGRGVGGAGVAAVVVAALFLILAVRRRGTPMINDFTTDPADPPAFRHAASLAPNVGRDLSYPPAFAAIQRACCTDLQPVRLGVAPDVAFTRARAVAQSMSTWTITDSDPATGAIEAVDTTRLFGFQDDIAIRVRPDADGKGSRVDMRSKSRVGKGDQGANAARIRAYVAALNAQR